VIENRRFCRVRLPEIIGILESWREVGLHSAGDHYHHNISQHIFSGVGQQECYGYSSPCFSSCLPKAECFTQNFEGCIENRNTGPFMVVHMYHLSYLGGEDQKNSSSKKN
jgi:hypothetical protein